jgi:hypothetical protein
MPALRSPARSRRRAGRRPSPKALLRSLAPLLAVCVGAFAGLALLPLEGDAAVASMWVRRGLALLAVSAVGTVAVRAGGPGALVQAFRDEWRGPRDRRE